VKDQTKHRIGCHPTDHSPAKLGHPVGWGTLQPGQQSVDDRRHCLFYESGNQIISMPEVLVERCAPDTRLGSYVGKHEFAVTQLGQKRLGRVENPLPGKDLVFLDRTCLDPGHFPQIFAGVAVARASDASCQHWAVIVDAALYQDGLREPGSSEIRGHGAACRQRGCFSWIGLYEPTEEEFEEVTKEFDLHELAVEDAIHAHQRPKLELYGDTMLVVLKPARYVDTEEVVELGEILLFVASNFVVAVRHGAASALSEVRKQLEAQPEELKMGPGAVLLEVVERVVDDYASVLSGLANDIEELEKQVFSDVTTTPTQRIYKLKREVLEFHQATSPLLEPLDRLARGRFGGIERELREYFRDAHDHLLRVVDRISTFRDLLTSILEANLTQVSVRQNNDMRRISAWVAIAAVPTAMAGIWGMNFRVMPELERQWGYPLAISLMVGACSFLYRRFKRSGWL